MPYLPTSQAFLEQSSQLLKAYPDTTRITTKYSYPRTSSKTNRISKRPSKSKTTTSTETAPAAGTETTTETATAKPATLTLKTFDPHSGICLKYRTNKAAEVGRLIVGLGKLASGEGGFEDSSVGVGAAGAGGDVEMGDAPTPPVGDSGGVGSGAEGVGKVGGAGGGGGGGGGGKKKKSGKGKR